MAIYSPDPFLTSIDKRLLFLLGQLVLDLEGVDVSSNRSKESVQLTGAEATELLDLLEQFTSSRRFSETGFFLETLFSSQPYDGKKLRDIYLSWRRFHGKSRALATEQWEALLSRLGVAPRYYSDSPWYRVDAKPMDLDYFLRMERILAKASGLSPRVQDLVLSYVRLQFDYLHAVRTKNATLQHGQIAAKPKGLIALLRESKSSRLGVEPISTSKIAATITIVLDLSAAYTTRDWSVAGFISTIAGAAPATVLD